MSELSELEGIRELIKSNSDLKPALERLQEIIDKFGDSELKNQLAVLNNRYVSFKSDQQRGVLSHSVADNQKNKIVSSILDFTSDLEKRKKSQVSQHHKHHSASKDSELLAAAKTAVLLVEIEKFKHRYYHLDYDLREEALDELRAYEPVVTKESRIEVYRFLYEVADEINYRSSASLGITLLSLVMHFSPGKDEECSEVVETSIAIGKKMVFASIFKAEHFKIGSNGLSIWKWAYLKAKWRDKAALMRQIETEYEELEAAIRKEEHDIINLAKKRQVIEAFKKDLTVDGMDFPAIPRALLDFV
jgi:hypothetical protein